MDGAGTALPPVRPAPACVPSSPRSRLLRRPRHGLRGAHLGQVPAYAMSSTLQEDLRRHIGAVFRAVLATILEGRPAERADFPTTAAQASATGPPGRLARRTSCRRSG